jgi:peptidoglycan/LPS O-acetylase OafA/YrhL
VVVHDVSGRGLRHQPALDGLRGLAVAAVLLYHQNVSWMHGGYLGVDLFFVLSGYLITSLLVTEWQASGTIALRAFWARRARRLLPALLALLIAVAMFGPPFATVQQRAGLRLDVVATLGYVANWRAIVSGHAYMDRFSVASPLMHTWSLAIEEQWYLVWPLLVVAVLRGRGGLRRLGGVAVGLTVVTAGWGWWITRSGISVSRGYYGTDTRAPSLLIGALLAIALTAHPVVRGRLAVWSLHAAAVLGAGIIGWLWVTTPTDSPSLFHGRLLLGAVCAAAVIADVVQPGPGLLARACSWRPLMTIGLVSYGVYLWHWPVFLVLDPARTTLRGWPLFGLRCVVTGLLATTSYVLLERPIRLGAARRWPVALRYGTAPAAAAAALVGVVVVTAGAATGPSLESIASRIHRSPPPPTAASLAGRTRVMVSGDSTAMMLAVGFGSSGDAIAGLQISDAAALGCGLLRDGTVDHAGVWQAEPTRCNWDNAWSRHLVATYRPDVVVFLTGVWDLPDRRIAGELLRPGNVAYGRYFTAELDSLLKLLSPNGAHIALLTSPYYTRAPSADRDRALGDPHRVDAMNNLLRVYASTHPTTTTVIDYGAWIDAHDSATLRPDGVHLAPDTAHLAADWLALHLRNSVHGPS